MLLPQLLLLLHGTQLNLNTTRPSLPACDPAYHLQQPLVPMLKLLLLLVAITKHNKKTK
jgi:hypothetical protein